jgi:hypothetical protein
MREAYLNKYDCLPRAKTLLASSDPAALRYACLELRMYMEAITYEKLAAYAPRLPPDVLSRWQPPQAVAALLELEDEAGEEYKVAIGRTRDSLQYLGEHRTFALPWLRKHYNKLGGFLHVPNRNTPAPTADAGGAEGLREYLEEIFTECERVVESSITSTMARVVEFTCQACGRKTVANAASAERRGRVQCFHPGCQAEHAVTRQEGDLYFRLTGSVFPCQSCGHHMFIATKQLVPEYEFACDACGRRHKLVDKVWRYAAKVEPPTEAS